MMNHELVREEKEEGWRKKERGGGVSFLIRKL